MPRHVPIPPELQQRAFSTAEALAVGIGERRVRGRDLVRPFHGVRSTAEATDILQRCRAYLPRLREGQFFSHETAAHLWGIPLPRHAEPDAPLHVAAFAPNRPPRTRGVIGHELRPGSVRVLQHSGLPMADAASTWLQLGTMLRIDDLVAAGDHLVLDPAVVDPLDPRPYAEPSELASALRAFRGRGRRTLVTALELVRPGAESRPETLLRLLLHRAGLPEPAVNFSVRDERGRFLARVDLAFPEERVAVEYDGDHHRTSVAQYEPDIARFDRLHEAGWTVIRVRARGLFRYPDDTVARVRRALAAARPGR